MVIPASDEKNLEFYDQETIRKIIDFQYEIVGKFVKMNMYIYLLGFMVPIVLSIYITDAKTLNYLFCIAFVVELYFMYFEILQIKAAKMQYFKDVWNYIDLSQFFFFMCVFSSRMIN